MSLINEYGEKKYNEGYNKGYGKEIEESIAKCLKYGDEPKDLAKKFNKSLKEIIEIKNKNNI